MIRVTQTANHECAIPVGHGQMPLQQRSFADGMTDATAAIQRLVDALNATPYRVLHMPNQEARMATETMMRRLVK